MCTSCPAAAVLPPPPVRRLTAGPVAAESGNTVGDASLPRRTLACKVLGHRWWFEAEGADVAWRCARGCGEGGRRTRADADAAQRLATHLNRGAPRPPTGLLAALGGTVLRRPPSRD